MTDNSNGDGPAMRTKRRYAHELYPHPAEGEIQPLTTAVPYLYARALGLDVHGTSWMKRDDRRDVERSNARLSEWVTAGQRALIADALLQGMAGTQAWQWAEERSQPDNLGEWVWERAVHYGVQPDTIKPYPCGPEPDHHDHLGDPDVRGWRKVTHADGRESDCPDCCEPIVLPVVSGGAR